MSLYQKFRTQTILLIDDDDDDQEIFESALKSIDSSYKLIGIQRAEEALALLKNELIVSPDVVFLDLNMPGMSGKEFLIEARRSNLLSATPVIIYSTTPRPEEVKNLGASDFLMKPNSYSDLQKSLKSILDKIRSVEPAESVEGLLN